jgi:hypothetical protein
VKHGRRLSRALIKKQRRLISQARKPNKWLAISEYFKTFSPLDVESAVRRIDCSLLRSYTFLPHGTVDLFDLAECSDKFRLRRRLPTPGEQSSAKVHVALFRTARSDSFMPVRHPSGFSDWAFSGPG